MNTKPTALAFCGLLAAVTAHAQTSSLQLYGAVDVYAASQRATGSGQVAAVNSGFNPNAFGIAGTEDLGAGMAAGFVLEGQPSLDTGAFGQGGKFFGRQSLVFLSGPFGRAGFGRQHTPGRTIGVKYSPSGWLTTDAFGNLQLAAGSAISAGMNADTVGGRLSNSISYITPDLAGIKVSAIHSLDEKGQFASGQARMTQLGIGYAATALEVDLAASHIPTVAGSQMAQRDFGIGAAYKASFARLFAAYQWKKGFAVANAADTTPIAGSWGTDRIVAVGAQVPLSPNLTLGLSWSSLKVAQPHRGRRQANVGAPFSAAIDDATAWSFATTYALSRRTQLFASYGRLKNDAAGTASLSPSLRPVAGGSSSMLAAGVRHTF